MSDVKQLIQNVRRSLASTYEILGYVGVDGSGAQVLLGRDLAINALVGIVAREDATNGAPLSVDVQRTLGRTVMVSGSMCPECRTPLPELDAFCFHCGANLSGSTAPVGTPDSAMVLAALATATSGRYEILGRLDREGATGAAYFARDLASDNIAALRLTRVEAVDASKPEYIERLTNIFETGAIQAQMAERKVQQDAERAAAERAAVERANAERAAVERANAERALAERIAADRAAAERVVAESTAAAAYIPPSITDSSPVLYEDQAAALSAIQHHASTPDANAAPLTMGKTVLISKSGIGIVVVALLAVVGYIAFRGGNRTGAVATTPTVADSIKAPPVAAVAPVDSSPPPTTPTPAPETPAVAATTAAIAAPTDSGTIRVGELPADARVTVDGRSMRGKTLRVSARAHQLTVTAKGFEVFKEKVTIASGATVKWAPKLVATVVAAAPTNNTPTPTPVNTPSNSVSKKSCRELMRIEDFAAAHETCATEADAGNASAQASMGRMYAKGLGLTRDAAIAVTWYRKSAASGDHESQTFMGYALRDGNGVKRDDKESAQLFKLAAEGGDKAAQLEYAVALEKGDGLKKDQASAREWYKKSADQGVSMAARRLGHMFEKGDGGPKSEPEAIAAYERAATLGDAESAMTVGKWYRDGRGVAQSPAQALIWFKKALDLGHKDAQNEIKKLQK